MENIGLGLLLMVVGMATTFIILLIIIWLSNGLISLVNKFAPEEDVKKETRRKQRFEQCSRHGCYQGSRGYPYCR